MKIPESVQDFTVGWMNEALSPHLAGRSVTDVSAQPHATPGQTADVVAINVQYDHPCELPDSFVAKIASKDPSTLDNVVRPLDLYNKEYSFYAEGIEGISYPRCFHLRFDTESHNMVLLFEDVSHMKCPSWAPTLEQVELAIDKLAPFHARWWNNEELRSKKWLTSGADPGLIGMYAQLANAAIPAVDELMEEDMSYSHELVRAFYDNLSGALAWLDSRAYTFVHGDYHPKQMFFGDPGSKDDFVMIDWQLPLRTIGANDLARIITVGLDTETRRQNEERLILRYYRLLEDNGVRNFALEDLLDDYRHGIFMSAAIHYLATATNVQLFIDEVTALGLDWRDVATYRLQRALQDHDGHKLISQWGGQ